MYCTPVVTGSASQKMLFTSLCRFFSTLLRHVGAGFHLLNCFSILLCNCIFHFPCPFLASPSKSIELTDEYIRNRILKIRTEFRYVNFGRTITSSNGLYHLICEHFAQPLDDFRCIIGHCHIYCCMFLFFNNTSGPICPFETILFCIALQQRLFYCLFPALEGSTDTQYLKKNAT